MTKAHNKSGTGSQKPATGNTKTTPTNKQRVEASSTSGSTSQSKSPKPQTGPSISIQTEKSKEKQSSKNHKSVIGGTAVQGAKSTQPKEIKATSPTQQEDPMPRNARINGRPAGGRARRYAEPLSSQWWRYHRQLSSYRPRVSEEGRPFL